MKKINFVLQTLLIITLLNIVKSTNSNSFQVSLNKSNLVMGNKNGKKIENNTNLQKNEKTQKSHIFLSSYNTKKEKYKALIIISHVLTYISFLIIICLFFYFIYWCIMYCTMKESKVAYRDNDYLFTDFWEKLCGIYCYCCCY